MFFSVFFCEMEDFWKGIFFYTRGFAFEIKQEPRFANKPTPVFLTHTS
tara:strand:- start:242 stop:385 length:144 start_codon:yes stop_codon:yes gene_type:complete